MTSEQGSSAGLPSHLDFSVGNVTRSIAFYHPLLTSLGFERYCPDDADWQEPDPTRAAWGIRYPDSQRFGIDLRPATQNIDRAYDRYEPGPHHLALNAASDEQVDQVHDAMRRAGATLLDPPANYGGQIGYGDHYYAVFFEDPDGFKVEVVNARGLDS